jgi:D-glycero-D-manno-heptose 1,7-bisphosphate phosphatase
MADKAIFFDCDGTLIEDPGYINHPDQVKLLAGVTDALVELRAMGYKLVVVSNQSGVARGIITEKVLGQIYDRLKQLLAEKNAAIDRIYYCPYHPDGVIEKYRKESNDRKPAPGMLLTAAAEMNIDLNQSWMIGNSDRDIEAGLQAGCKTVLINYSAHRLLEAPACKPHYRAVNMKEAVNIIKQLHRCTVKPATQPQSPKEAQSQPPEANQPQPPKEIQSVVSPSNPLQPNPQSGRQPDGSDQLQTESSAEAAPSHAKAEAPSAKQIPVSGLEQLLISILDQLKIMRRAETFDEFSLTKLIAGALQVIVLFFILMTVWFLMSPTSRGNSVIITLGFAVLLQLMVLTFYIMQGRK